LLDLIYADAIGMLILVAACATLSVGAVAAFLLVCSGVREARATFRLDPRDWAPWLGGVALAIGIACLIAVLELRFGVWAAGAPL
jgi:hypothetical protein